MWAQEMGRKIECRFENGCDVMFSWLKFLCVSVFLFSLVSVPWVSATNGGVVSLEVAEAEEALVSAYGVVLEAEEAGADVSGLLDKLNVGDEYLAEANAYVRLGNSESAGHFAGLCVEAVGDVGDEAVLLRDEAMKLGEADFIVTMIGSVVGVVVVVVAGFVVWRVFKRRYHKRVSG
jgi:ribosomal protein L19